VLNICTLENLRLLIDSKESRVNDNQPIFLQKKKSRFNKLNEAVAFESFFSIQICGAKNDFRWWETIIPALDSLIEKLPKEESSNSLGMAHRGRLNVLANIFENQPKISSENLTVKITIKSILMGMYHLGLTADKN
jgi:2-oxoglutarate dehydrogenase E1 component